MQSKELRLAELYTRGRVCLSSGIPAPPDLLGGLLECIREELNSVERRASRDHSIRRAALLLDGSAWQKAEALKREAKALSRRHKVQPGSVSDHLKSAAELHPLPESCLSFYRILKAGD